MNGQWSNSSRSRPTLYLHYKVYILLIMLLHTIIVLCSVFSFCVHIVLEVNFGGTNNENKKLREQAITHKKHDV
jgi:hypothetical protein